MFAGAAEDKKKPADAKSINDKKGEVTAVADGATATAKLPLKYCLDIQGWFDKDGLNITEVNAEGPAGHLAMKMGEEGEAALEPGDIIVEVDGKKVTTPKDYADALNNAKNHDGVKLKVKDVRTGDMQEFFAKSSKRDS